MIKSKYIVVLVLITLVTACDKSGDINKEQTNFINNRDSQFYYNTSPEIPMADSEDAYYFINGNNMSYIYYMDKKSNDVLPLCSKLECEHDSVDCDACLGSYGENQKNRSILFLKYYEDELYYVYSEVQEEGGDTIVLCKMELDGTRQKELYAFSEYVLDIALHRGYVYFTTNDFATLPGTDSLSTATFYRMSLDPAF